jgi:hypothetical protein
VTLAEVRAAIQELTPLPDGELVELGRGADSVAFMLDGEWVLRFPVTANAQHAARNNRMRAL